MTSRHRKYEEDSRVLKILDAMPWGIIKEKFWEIEGADSPVELQQVIDKTYHRKVPDDEMFYPHLGDFR